MIRTHDVLLKNNLDWLLFSNPYQIFQTSLISKVEDTLQEVEDLVNGNGWYAAGFVSYEAAPAFDNALPVREAGEFPLLWFGLYPEPTLIETASLFHSQQEPPAPRWQADIKPEPYDSAILQIKEAIARGETYQVNYTMRLHAEYPQEPWILFSHLALYQNKYAAYIDTGRFGVCSASPELFFKLDGDRIYSQPMKGTAPRGRTTAEDRVRVKWLKNSIKNRAENVMIVDMIRNDLGRIAQTGSVQTPALFQVEKYPTLFQMTSTVQARTNASLKTIFSALFPCASITGAPKVRTMKLISELESSTRKIYTGSIGYLAPNRKAQFNVAIRTAVVDREKGRAEYGVGGGIVWDSTSRDEYREALLKAQVLTHRPREFSLFESMRWTPENGFDLLENHILRLQDSAEYFDFPFSRADMVDLLTQFVVEFARPRRIKISLDRFGRFTAEATDLNAGKTTFTAHLAEQPIDSQNKFFYHKTTLRDIYPSPQEKYDEVLLYNKKRELTEFTIGNLVLEIDNQRFTPPIACGLLAGTFRADLLASSRIQERVLHPEDLLSASKIYLINSIRKWVPVRVDLTPLNRFLPRAASNEEKHIQ